MHPSFRLGFEKVAFTIPGTKIMKPKPFSGAHMSGQMRQGLNAAVKAAPKAKSMGATNVIKP